MKQMILHGSSCLHDIIELHNIKKIFIVHSKSYYKLSIANEINNLDVFAYEFSDFSSNPLYVDIYNAVIAFRESKCDTILAVGGGSAIDVAKCVKLFAFLSNDEFFCRESYCDSGILLIAIPTTAGTGSESTSFAAMYKDNEKHSVFHESLRPNYALLVPDVLSTLPLYQKKCTVLDALCQSIEAWWSINSTEESIAWSCESIKLLSESLNAYFDDDNRTNDNILLGANYSGRAINIAQTTGAHALSYKLTSDFDLPHGHAVAVCLPAVWQCMLDNMDKVCDIRGNKYVYNVFFDISIALGYGNPHEAISGFRRLLERLVIRAPTVSKDEIIDNLVHSVNQERLKNSPIAFDNKLTYQIYRNILQGE